MNKKAALSIPNGCVARASRVSERCMMRCLGVIYSLDFKTDSKGLIGN